MSVRITPEGRQAKLDNVAGRLADEKEKTESKWHELWRGHRGGELPRTGKACKPSSRGGKVPRRVKPTCDKSGTNLPKGGADQRSRRTASSVRMQGHRRVRKGVEQEVTAKEAEVPVYLKGGFASSRGH